MKIDWNRKYTTISIYTFIVICCSVVFYRIASDLSVFTSKLSSITTTLQPFIIGSVIAYLLNFILRFYEEKVFVKGNMLGDSMYYGRGAGKLPTASAVVADILPPLFKWNKSSQINLERSLLIIFCIFSITCSNSTPSSLILAA